MPQMDVKPAFQAEKVTGRFMRMVDAYRRRCA